MHKVAAALFAVLVSMTPDIRGAEAVQFTRFLLPLYHNSLKGAHGSVWQVETWGRYSGARQAHYVPDIAICVVLCPGIGGELSPQTAPFQFDAVYASDSGLLFHFDRTLADVMTLSSRIRDVSRQLDSAGTDVPVIREDAMSEISLHLLNVPLAPTSRDALRIYALPEVQDPEVEVRYLRMPRRGIDGETIVVLRSDRVRLKTYAPTQGFFIHPSFAMISNFHTLPELSEKHAVWIEVVPITPGLRIWAFVSVTNNETQQVTLVTPNTH